MYVLLFEWRHKQTNKNNNNNKGYGKACLMRLPFQRCFPLLQPDDGSINSPDVASLNILVHDVINLLYYEQ